MRRLAPTMRLHFSSSRCLEDPSHLAASTLRGASRAIFCCSLYPTTALPRSTTTCPTLEEADSRTANRLAILLPSRRHLLLPTLFPTAAPMPRSMGSSLATHRSQRSRYVGRYPHTIARLISTYSQRPYAGAVPLQQPYYHPVPQAQEPLFSLQAQHPLQNYPPRESHCATYRDGSNACSV